MPEDQIDVLICCLKQGEKGGRVSAGGEGGNVLPPHRAFRLPETAPLEKLRLVFICITSLCG